MKTLLLGLTLALAPLLTWADKTTSCADQNDRRAHSAVRSGRFVPLEVLLKDALQRVPGEVIDVELDDAEYEIEVLDADGVVWEFEYDARTGKLQDLERDD